MQDITSGKCFNTNKPSGRAFTPQEHEDFTKCGFNSQEGFELGEQLECNVCLPYSPLSATPVGTLLALMIRMLTKMNVAELLYGLESINARAGHESGD